MADIPKQTGLKRFFGGKEQPPSGSTDPAKGAAEKNPAGANVKAGVDPAAAKGGGGPHHSPPPVRPAVAGAAPPKQMPPAPDKPVATAPNPPPVMTLQFGQPTASGNDVKIGGTPLAVPETRVKPPAVVRVPGRPSRGETGRFGVQRLRPIAFEPDFEVDVPYRKLAIFARSSETGAPIPRLPLYVVAEVVLTTGQQTPGTRLRYPLGTLGTDHAGFSSFDLTVLFSSSFFARARARLAAQIAQATSQPVVQVALDKLFVRPFQLPPNSTAGEIDALTRGELGPDFVVLLLTFSEAELAARDTSRPMASIQSPSLIDYRLSPSSFSLANTLLIGEDGCETMLPAGLSNHLYKFRQLAITEHAFAYSGSVGSADATIPPDAWLGVAIDYEAEWTAIGHSLGDLSYSLALAPGERTKIAVVDWSRTDRSDRSETTGFTERLDHYTLRDRGIDETVSMAVGEQQKGSSHVAGVAASGSGSVGPISFGASASYSTASTSSSGSRNLEGKTVQDLADGFLQASSAVRELKSTVVVQGAQAESSTANTRAVANYNHSHALTILYYGVQRHYKVVIRPTERAPVLLVPPSYLEKFALPDLTDWAWAIEKVLLDGQLQGCLDKARLLPCPDLLEEATSSAATPTDDKSKVPPVPAPTTEDYAIGNIPLRDIVIEANLVAAIEYHRLGFLVELTSGSNLRLTNPAPWATNRDAVSIPATITIAGRMVPAEEVKWRDVKAIKFYNTLGQGADSDDRRAVRLRRLRFSTRFRSQEWEIYKFEETVTMDLPVSTKPSPRITTINREDFGPFPAPDALSPEADEPRPDQPPHPEPDASAEKKCCIEGLLAHVNAHRAYYEAAIYSAAGLLPKASSLFDPAGFNGEKLDRLVARRPAGVADGMLALPLRPGALERLTRAISDPRLRAELDAIVTDDDYLLEYAEQLVTLPVRGVFAEAKLGHCNASEVIDDTRFWKWHEAPIPDEAPAIDPVSTGSRYQALPGTTPTAMPGSMVNIVSPTAAPDPTGFTAASALMAAMGPFRDMSGIDAANSLAAVLTEGSRSLAEKEAERRKQIKPPAGDGGRKNPRLGRVDPAAPGGGGNGGGENPPGDGGEEDPPPEPEPDPESEEPTDRTPQEIVIMITVPDGYGVDDVVSAVASAPEISSQMARGQPERILRSNSNLDEFTSELQQAFGAPLSGPFGPIRTLVTLHYDRIDGSTNFRVGEMDLRLMNQTIDADESRVLGRPNGLSEEEIEQAREAFEYGLPQVPATDMAPRLADAGVREVRKIARLFWRTVRRTGGAPPIIGVARELAQIVWTELQNADEIHRKGGEFIGYSDLIARWYVARTIPDPDEVPNDMRNRLLDTTLSLEGYRAGARSAARLIDGFETPERAEALRAWLSGLTRDRSRAGIRRAILAKINERITDQRVRELMPHE